MSGYQAGRRCHLVAHVITDIARRVGRRRRALNVGDIQEAKTRFGRYWFPALAGEEMFDIVNREYEENGSFRCDFSQRKNVIAILAVLCVGRVLPLSKTQNS